MNTIKNYIITLFNENNLTVGKIKITKDFNFNLNQIFVEINNSDSFTVVVEKYESEYSDVVEFYDNNNQLIAKAKGFDSVQ